MSLTPPSPTPTPNTPLTTDERLDALERQNTLLTDRLEQMSKRFTEFIPANELQARIEDKTRLIMSDYLAPFENHFRKNEDIWKDISAKFGEQVLLNARLSVALDQFNEERTVNRENASRALELAQSMNTKQETFMIQFTGENGIFADLRETRIEVEDIESILRMQKTALKFFIGVFKSNIFKATVGLLLGGGATAALFGQQIMKSFTP